MIQNNDYNCRGGPAFLALTGGICHQIGPCLYMAEVLEHVRDILPNFAFLEFDIFNSFHFHNVLVPFAKPAVPAIAGFANGSYTFCLILYPTYILFLN